MPSSHSGLPDVDPDVWATMSLTARRWFRLVVKRLAGYVPRSRQWARNGLLQQGPEEEEEQ